MTTKEQIKAIIKQYADKGKKMYSETIDSRGSRYNAGFWDGYECCAKGLLRELEDMQEEPVSEDLEEAAKNYPSAIYVVSPQWGGEIRAAFKAGANLQKQQMMKDAVEGEVSDHGGGYLYVYVPLSKDCGLSHLDKVKVLVIKED